MPNFFLCLAAVLGTTLCAISSLAAAQAYPVKPIRATVGTPTGGPGDVAMRGAGQAITQALGQPVVVENRVSVGSIVSAEACAKGNPDGYSLCVCSQQVIALNPVTRSRLPYSPSELAPVAFFGTLAAGIHVHPSLSPRTLPELLDLAKAKPRSVTWGSYGLTSPPYLYIEWLKKAKGVEFLNVPYKAASFAWPAMLSGEVQVSYFALTGNALQMVKAGKARTLAVTMERRSPELPDVPTYREAGLEFAIVSWFALCAPAATPREIIARLNNVVNRGLMENPEAKAKFLSSQGIETDPPAGGSPAAIAQYFAAEQKRYAEIVRITGVKED